MLEMWDGDVRFDAKQNLEAREKFEKAKKKLEATQAFLEFSIRLAEAVGTNPDRALVARLGLEELIEKVKQIP